ncbi:hypothetical protein ACFL96_04740 [Thermoproteota archaeon]
MRVVGVTLIRLIGKFLIVRGIWILVHDFRATLFTFRLLPERVSEWGIPVVALIVYVSLVVPLCYIIGGVGLVFVKHWGRMLAFFGLWFNVLFSLTCIASKWYFQLVLKSSPLIIKNGHNPTLFIMISSYVLALIEVIIIIFLMRPRVREELK